GRELKLHEGATAGRRSYALLQLRSPQLRSPQLRSPQLRSPAVAYLTAPHTSGYVARLCPRYCGRNPNSTTCPAPRLTSTSAALPLSLAPPRSQPDRSGFPVTGYDATTVACVVSSTWNAGLSSNHTAGTRAKKWRAIG